MSAATCDECDGSGLDTYAFADGSTIILGYCRTCGRCNRCHGRGHDGYVDPNGEPNPNICPVCGGTGRVPSDPQPER